MNEELRNQVYSRDNYKCCNCGNEKGLVVHHIIPKGKGGKDEMDNLITLCSGCHSMPHMGFHRYIGLYIKQFREIIKEKNKEMLKNPKKLIIKKKCFRCQNDVNEKDLKKIKNDNYCEECFKIMLRIN